MRAARPARPPGLRRTGRTGCVAAPRRRHQRSSTAAAAAAAATPDHSPSAITVGLKEWAPLVHAAAAGSVTAFVRKGGIREAGFSLAGKGGRAVLVPTSFHAAAAGLTPEVAAATPPDVLAFDQRGVDPVPLTVGAEWTAAWTVTGPPDAVAEFLAGQLAGSTGLGPRGAAARAAPPRRGAAPGAPTNLTLVELRVCELHVAGGAPAGLAQATPGLWGCRSWVALPPPPPAFSLGPPVLGAGAWAAAQERLRGVVEGGGLPPGVAVEAVGVLS